jgi:exodeoxyribonuclease VII large subunit
MEITDLSQNGEVYSVSRLNREARFILEGSFPLIWIEGEISNFVVPNSGHWYFSLKDTDAQARCAMFRLNNCFLGFIPKNGMHVMMKCRVSLYEGKGEFQLIAEHMEEMGEGKLRAAFEALKKRLQAAGFFNEENKKLLPALPQCIGVVTSPTGAAIRDIISVLKRRFPALPVIIYPTLVQGTSAAAQIAAMLRLANRRKECDILIVARGGGSLEDLWPFNEEIVAQAIYESAIPVVSGVGHEIDFTIADFVADLRAPTPSAAAELVVPDVVEFIESFSRQKNRLTRLMQQMLLNAKQHIVWLNKHLQQQHPKRRLAEKSQRLDFSEAALVRLITQRIASHENKLNSARLKLLSATPLHHIRKFKNILSLQHQGLINLMKTKIQLQQQNLGNMAAKIDALSPLATLQRGFSITMKERHVVHTINDVDMGDRISVRLVDGQLECEVLKII